MDDIPSTVMLEKSTHPLLIEPSCQSVYINSKFVSIIERGYNTQEVRSDGEFFDSNIDEIIRLSLLQGISYKSRSIASCVASPEHQP